MPRRDRRRVHRVSAAALLRPAWAAPAGVQACTTLRFGAGVSAAPFDAFNLGAACGDDADAVRANRAALRTLAGLPVRPRWLRQVHGTDVLRFGEDDVAAIDAADDDLAVSGEADAAVTDAPGVVLAILTADCLPVLFASRDGRRIGAAHAGWRGLHAGVLEATVAAMQAPADGLVAWLGPAAGPTAYEVGTEVFDAFTSHDAASATHFTPTRPGHWHADLFALARRRLHAAGVTAVAGGDACTLTEPARFFSHRRDGRSGRMATLVWRDA